MAMADTQDRPGVEERLLVAANTSSLLVDFNRRTATDVIMAAGAAGRYARLGIALIHLASEWDRAEKPRKRTKAEIAERAAELPQKKGKPDIRRAEVEALVWHATALRERARTLTGRSTVMGMLTDWATERGTDVDLLSPALFHWLSPHCPVCTGLSMLKMEDAPTLSKKTCPHCHGSGTWPRPLGAQDIHDHIKSCVGAARGKLAEKLRG